MNIKYYRLAKDEEPPEEFCAVRDVGGEPSEYVFYVQESEVAKLRKKSDMLQWNSDCFIKIYGSWKRLRATVPHLERENAKLQELFNETLIRLAAASEAAGGGFMDTRYCELLESHGIEVD